MKQAAEIKGDKFFGTNPLKVLYSFQTPSLNLMTDQMTWSRKRWQKKKRGGGGASFINSLLFAVLTPVKSKIVIFLLLVASLMPALGPYIRETVQNRLQGSVSALSAYGAAWRNTMETEFDRLAGTCCCQRHLLWVPDEDITDQTEH